MNYLRATRSISPWVAVAIALLAWPSTFAEVPGQLSDPDGKPAAANKPLQVFILLGQSNMLDFGRIDPEDKNGTLSYLVKQEENYPHLIDEAGNWTERKDVRNVHVMDKRGAGLTESNGNVKTIDARPFWRDAGVSPSGAGYHYNHNAETYMEVGNALGRAMAELLEGEK